MTLPACSLMALTVPRPESYFSIGTIALEVEGSWSWGGEPQILPTSQDQGGSAQGRRDFASECSPSPKLGYHLPSRNRQGHPGRWPSLLPPPPRASIVPTRYSPSSKCLLFFFLCPLAPWVVEGGGVVMARAQRQPREGGDPVLGDEPGVRNGEPAPRGARAPSSCANTAAPTHPAAKDKRPSSELGLSRMWPWLIHPASSESLWPLTPSSSPSNSSLKPKP